jgi:hypothetical protein
VPRSRAEIEADIQELKERMALRGQVRTNLSKVFGAAKVGAITEDNLRAALTGDDLTEVNKNLITLNRIAKQTKLAQEAGQGGVIPQSSIGRALDKNIGSWAVDTAYLFAVKQLERVGMLLGGASPAYNKLASMGVGAAGPGGALQAAAARGVAGAEQDEMTLTGPDERERKIRGVEREKVSKQIVGAARDELFEAIGLPKDKFARQAYREAFPASAQISAELVVARSRPRLHGRCHSARRQGRRYRWVLDQGRT